MSIPARTRPATAMPTRRMPGRSPRRRAPARWLVFLVAGIVSVAAAGVPVAAEPAQWAEPEKVSEVEAGEREQARVTWWGFDAEDSTEYMQAAIDSGAAHVTVPDTGQTWKVRAPIDLSQDDQTIEFEARVVVKGKEGSISGRGDNLFHARARSGLTITGHGATLRMPFVPHAERGTNMGGHLIFLDGSEDVLVEGLTLEEGHRDGIYVGGHTYCRDITIRDVVADGNWRQGISIVNVDGVVVEDSVFKNTRGKSPHSGIDAETHSPDERLSNVVVRNSMFLDNLQIGMHNWPSHQDETSAPISILWEGNYVRGGEIGMHVASINPGTPEGEIIFRDNVVEGTQHAGILARRVAADSKVQITFEGNLLVNTAQKKPYSDEIIEYYREAGILEHPLLWWRPKSASAPIVLTAQGQEPRTQGNIHFEDNLVIHNLDEPAIVVEGPWPEHQELFGEDAETIDERFQRWENISGTVRVVNPYGARMDIQAPVENFTLEIE